MAQRLPQANLATNKYTDSQLIARAQEVHDKILANVATFATPPVSMATLQTAIDNYRNATVAAIKGSKAQTTDKRLYKDTLVLMLKRLAIYVTQIAQAAGAGTPYYTESIKQIILLSGFQLSFDPKPVSPIVGIKAPQIRRVISDEPGKLKILLRQYTDANRNTLLYQVNYRTSAVPGTVPVPAGDWQTQTFTGQNQILLTGLTSGLSYDYQVASIGGRDVKRNDNPPINFTPIESVVII